MQMYSAHERYEFSLLLRDTMIEMSRPNIYVLKYLQSIALWDGEMIKENSHSLRVSLGQFSVG